MGNELAGALFNTLIGMGTVFAVLIFISLLISLFVYVPGLERAWGRLGERLKETFRNGGDKKTESSLPWPVPKRPVLPKEDKAGSAEEENEPDYGALIAVITAAIAASEGRAVSADRLVVRSIRRMNRS